LRLVRDTQRVAYQARDRRILGRLHERAHVTERVAHNLFIVGVPTAAHLGAHEVVELRRQRHFHGASPRP
jgi:hypothetical protein